MQAHANSTVSPLQPHPASYAADTAAAGQPSQGEEDNPLRLLLREIVRDEFEGELQRRLDDDLRRMVRSEIAAALTEALTRRSRA